MFALYSQKGRLLVGQLISPGVRSFATVDRKGKHERISRVHVHGIFEAEKDALSARISAAGALDPGTAKTAIKIAPGYRPLQ